jgi:MFS family permease
LAGLERDLKLVGYDYNILLTAFYVAVRLISAPSGVSPVLTSLRYFQYVVGEMPAQWLNKKLGVGRMIAAWCFLFGLFSFVMTFVKSFGAGIAVRFRESQVLAAAREQSSLN